MDNRNRLFGLAAASAVMIGLLWWQDRIIGNQRETISFHEKNISSLQAQLQKEVAAETELRRENELLRVENRSLRDSMFWLQNRVSQLEDRLQFEEKQLTDLRGQIAKKDRFLTFLKEKLANLEKERAAAAPAQPSVEAAVAAPPRSKQAASAAPSPAPSTTRSTIAARDFGKKPAAAAAPAQPSPTERLGAIFMSPKPKPQAEPVPKEKVEAAIAQTVQEKADLEKTASKMEADRSKTAASLDATKMMQRLRDEAADLARTTSVRFSNLVLKTEKAGKPIAELDKDGKNWFVTEMQIELSNPGTDLSDKRFAVEIVDTDSGQPLPNIESNPAFPNSPNNSAGFTFRWKGAALDATYFSRDAKTGRNYDLRVFHLFNNEKIEMPQATRPLLRNGKVAG